MRMDDPLSTARGAIYGTLIGALMWAGLIFVALQVL